MCNKVHRTENLDHSFAHFYPLIHIFCYLNNKICFRFRIELREATKTLNLFGSDSVHTLFIYLSVYLFIYCLK